MRLPGASHNPQAIELATRLATAEVDLLRARRTRLDLLDGQPFDNIRRLAAIEYYERRARTRRKLAVRAFNATARSLSARPQPARQELRKRTEPNVSEPALRKRTEAKSQGLSFRGAAK